MTKLALIWTLVLTVATAAVAGQAPQGSRLRFSSTEGLRFDLRGKAITFVIIEDTYFTTVNLGGELLYKSHSLGIDGSYFRWRFEHDDSDDVAMYQHFDRRTYLLFDYKFGFLHWGQNQLYLNSYLKTGMHRTWYTRENHPLSAADSIKTLDRSDGTFKEAGAGLGYKRRFKESRCGYDISANVAKRFSTTDLLTYSTMTTSEFEQDVRTTELLFYMRLNLYFTLARSKNPEQKGP